MSSPGAYPAFSTAFKNIANGADVQDELDNAVDQIDADLDRGGAGHGGAAMPHGRWTSILLLAGLLLAGWVAAPGIDPTTLVPYAKEMYDETAYESMRGSR